MELGHHLLRTLEVIVPETLDGFSCSPAEEGVFLVVPVSRDGIHAEVFPEAGEDVIGLGQIVLEVHQDGNGLSGDVPAAYPHAEVFRGGLALPGTEQGGIFQEIRVLRPVHPDVRTY